jgi:ABC-type glutathione transport system ATPase component
MWRRASPPHRVSAEMEEGQHNNKSESPDPRAGAHARGSAISIDGVVKRFGEITAVDGLELEVPMGVCFGLLGPNGAGKSTTMRMLTAQTLADEGTRCSAMSSRGNPSSRVWRWVWCRSLTTSTWSSPADRS